MKVLGQHFIKLQLLNNADRFYLIAISLRQYQDRLLLWWHSMYPIRKLCKFLLWNFYIYLHRTSFWHVCRWQQSRCRPCSLGHNPYINSVLRCTCNRNILSMEMHDKPKERETCRWCGLCWANQHIVMAIYLEIWNVFFECIVEIIRLKRPTTIASPWRSELFNYHLALLWVRLLAEQLGKDSCQAQPSPRTSLYALWRRLGRFKGRCREPQISLSWQGR